MPCPLAALLMLGIPLSGLRASQRTELRVLLVAAADPGAESIRRGAEFGAAEAAQTARLIGTHVDFRAITAGTTLTPADRAFLDAAQIIIAAVTPEQFNEAVGRRIQSLVIDVTPVGAAIACNPRVLHIGPLQHGVAGARLWDASLEKFGAQQLNQRFMRATGHAMDDGAWLGWFSLKLAQEITARASTTSVDSLVAFARSRRARFDGQKGVPLAFSPETGVLAQPYYVGDSDSALREASDAPEWPTCRARAP